MKTLFENCRMPLSGETAFCTDGENFCPVRPPFDEVRSLRGATVLPAFPDAHSHILACALSLLQADGQYCRTAQDFLAAAEAFARLHDLAQGELVGIRNACVLPGEEAFERHPRPLHVQMRSGHAGTFNAAARALLGIAGRGRLEEEEYLAAAQRIPPPGDRDVFAAFLQAQREYLAHGMTLAQEGFLTRQMFPLYEMLLHENALLADVVAYPSPANYAEARARFAGARRFRIGGMKIFLDGSPQQKTAFLREAYLGGGRGVCLMREEEVFAACRHAAGEGAQLLAHCNGDGAAEVFLNALSRLSERERRIVRPVLIHGQILGEDELDKAAGLGVIPSFFPAHVLHWGEEHLKNLGRARAERISPARSALTRGIPFTLHQDAPVCPPDPLEAARCAVLRETSAGNVFRAEAIGARDALVALTENAAGQYGLADRGRIAPGCRADFVLLDGDPLSDIRTARVRETWMRGECVFRREA